MTAKHNGKLVSQGNTKDMDWTKHRDAIFKIWTDTFKSVAVKPAAGTLRIVEALARPGFFVEFEFMAAR
jgi:hypothetical protein